MNEFVRRSKRVAGCVALVIALELIGPWMLSFTRRFDLVTWMYSGERQYLASERGAIFWHNDPRSTPTYRQGELTYCWSIVIPLTLLSAWLLLWKPRPAKPRIQQST